MMTDSVEERIKKLTEEVMKRERQLAGFAWNILESRGSSPSRVDIEDVLSEAYLTAATKVRNQENLIIENYFAWFRKVLFFACLKFAKKQGQLQEVQYQELEDEAQLLEIVNIHQKGQDPDVSILSKELLGALSETDQDIVKSSAEGYTSREIANRLSLSPESVRQRKKRALDVLKGLLK